MNNGNKKTEILKMAGVFLLMAAIAGGAFWINNSPKGRSALDIAGIETEKEPATTKVVEVEGFSFEINDKWEKPQEEYEMYMPDRSKPEYYGMLGYSPIGKYSEEEFFDELLRHYKSQGNTIDHYDETLTEKTTVDGDKYKIGRITMSDKNYVLYEIDVVLCPAKNYAVTFEFQGMVGKTSTYDLREISNTIRFKDETFDIAGKSFVTGDGSELVFDENGQFKYYYEADNYESSHHDGSYEICTGQAAIDKAVSLEQFGLTEEEIKNSINNDLNYGVSPEGDGGFSPGYSGEEGYHVSPDGFCAVVLHIEKTFYDTGEEKDKDDTLLFVGYYISEEQTFSFTNCASTKHVTWKLK